MYVLSGLVKVLVHLMEGDVDNLITDAQGLGFLPHELDQNTRKELFTVFCLQRKSTRTIAHLFPQVLSSIFEEAQLHTARQKANQVLKDQLLRYIAETAVLIRWQSRLGHLHGEGNSSRQ